jgi:hypothetical protein
MIRIILILLAGSFPLASGVSAQEGRQHGDTTMMRGRPKTGEMMMSMMDSADARLDRLVTNMNRATGATKVQAMAAVINELVAQRKQMRAHMGRMMDSGGMMGNGGGQHRRREMMRAVPDSVDHSKHDGP